MRIALLVTLLVLQPPAESSLGYHDEMPPIVGNEFPRTDKGQEFATAGMSGCAGFVLATGVLEAAEHELAESGANVRSLTLIAPRGSDALLQLADKRGRTVEIVLRLVEPRELRKVSR